MRRHDVAVCVPGSASYYGSDGDKAGGAERQASLLARSLQRRGVRTAHVVFPLPGRLLEVDNLPTLVERPMREGSGHTLVEPWDIWRSMAAADAQTYVFRGARMAVGVGAAFCRARGRRLVYSAAHDADFSAAPTGAPGWRKPLYDFGVRRAAAIVAQSAHQAELARRAYPEVPLIVEIPSLVESVPATQHPAEAFLWSGRLVDFKQPLEFIRLAEALPEARFRMIAAAGHGRTRDGRPPQSELDGEVRRRAEGLENLELLEGMPHPQVMALIERAVAVVNTSTFEGMPNMWLEGWSKGVPALTLAFDPDGRIAERGLGVAAGGSFEAFAAGARELWAGRADRAGYGPRVRAYVEEVHGADAVAARWQEILLP